jgi:hypothetical protein
MKKNSGEQRGEDFRVTTEEAVRPPNNAKLIQIEKPERRDIKHGHALVIHRWNWRRVKFLLDATMTWLGL